MITSLLIKLIDFYEILIVIYCLLSWFPIPQNGTFHDLAAALQSICAPYLDIFRRYIPPMGGVDFSPVVAILALSLLQRLVTVIL